ncbi:MAG: hypothetical protein JXR76_28345 [Deltaproteobacteria bacterium]|nr:hypothetical protein [Deltaproteobacteria bacterium]
MREKATSRPSLFANATRRIPLPLSAIIALVLQLFSASASANAASLCVACEWQQLHDDMAANNIGASIDRFKALRDAYPNRKAPVLLLASAYDADGNGYWALNVLYSWYQAHPNDCEVLSFIIWQQIKQLNVGGAKELMTHPHCPEDDTDKSRWKLISAYLDELNGQKVAAPSTLELAWPEDVTLWQSMWQRAAPGRKPPIEIRGALETGYTSNAQAGSSIDTAGSQSKSATGKLQVQAWFVAPTAKKVRPVMGLSTRLSGYLTDEARKYSYIDLAWQPGILLGRTTTLRLNYKGNLMLLNWPGKEIFHETHRLEFELSAPSGNLLFGGVGRRIYAENGRTRWEVDAGYGRTKILNSWATVLLGINGRYYDAIGDPYDEAGGGILGAAYFSLPHTMSMRTGVNTGMDFFFNSGGDLGHLAYGTIDKRRDLTFRHFDELWFPPLGQLKWGIRYEFNVRDSRADSAHGASDYDYQEHRAMLKLSFDLRANPLAPRTRETSDHVPLDYDQESSQNAQRIDSTEIIDMLRADEAARAASSCVE